MQYKRSFIPPEYRPFVNGSTLDNKELVKPIISQIKNPIFRSMLIMSIVNKRTIIKDLDENWAKSILEEIFPKLKMLGDKKSEKIK